jgi:hypothetical protein
LLEQQLAAAFIAAVLLAIFVAGLVRSRSPYIAVVFAVLVAIPIAGLTTFAVAPRPLLDFGFFVDIAFIPALIGLGAGSFIVAAAINRGHALTAGRLNLLAVAFVVLWIGIVLAISAFLAVWEPGFAIANLALNVAWFGFWAVPQTRVRSGRFVVDIKAPRQRVFAFMADASNWPRYVEQDVSVSVEPPGPLREGSRVKEVRRYDTAVRGPRVLPPTIEVVTEVTGVEPGASISLREAGLLASQRTEFTDVVDGTRISISLRVEVPFHQAFLGTILLMRSQRASRRAKTERNLAKLKAILEQP